MPGKERFGKWAKKPLRLGDLNELLKAALVEIGVRPITSHSMKAMVLTWAAARGLSTQTRSALEYHKIAGESNSVRCYSRDRLSQPVKELCSLMVEIREGKFHPEKDVDEVGLEPATQKWKDWPASETISQTQAIEDEPPAK